MQTEKPYLVSRVTGQPVFDSLPVAKITDYPLEPRDYRPFAQAILCAGEDRLHLRMWAFEVSPMPTSALACVLYLYPRRPEAALLLRIEHGEGDLIALGVHLLEGGSPVQLDGATQTALWKGLAHHPHNGEDLQGVYWGMTLSLPVALIEDLGGDKAALRPGDTIPGNFYKTCANGQFAHSGSYFPARFPDSPYGRDSMGPFQMVAY